MNRKVCDGCCELHTACSVGELLTKLGLFEDLVTCSLVIVIVTLHSVVAASVTQIQSFMFLGKLDPFHCTTWTDSFICLCCLYYWCQHLSTRAADNIYRTSFTSLQSMVVTIFDWVISDLEQLQYAPCLIWPLCIALWLIKYCYANSFTSCIIWYISAICRTILWSILCIVLLQTASVFDEHKYRQL